MSVTPDLDARFRAAAVGEHLVDVRYDVLDSPVGELHVAATDRGLCRISYWGDGWEEMRFAEGEGGSFVASTADFITLNDGTVFNAKLGSDGNCAVTGHSHTR